MRDLPTNRLIAPALHHRHETVEPWRIESGQLWRVWLPASISVALAGAMFWSVCRRPEVVFLTDDRSARWIVYPTVPEPGTRPYGPWRTVFHRNFSLHKLPGGARLTVKAHQEFIVSLNGVEVGRSESSQSWKKPQAFEIRGELLRVGENELAATVVCRQAPPAVSLALDLGSDVVATDLHWQASLLGADIQPVRLAVSVPEFGSGTGPASAERPLESLKKRWPTLLLFGALAALIVAFWRRSRSSAALTWFATHSDLLLCAAIATAWLAMLIWNWPSLRFFLGFDSALHLEYVEYIKRHGSLPIGTEGPEMWQPPLYYVISAVVTSLAGTPADSQTATLLGRAIAYLLSLSQLLLLAGCMRRLLPQKPWPRAAALGLAGCVPMQLYLMQYNSNDVLAAALATASLYTAITVIQSPNASIRRAACLGVLMGATVLAKLTAWPVMLVILLVLAWQLAAEQRPARDYMTRLLVPFAVCGLLCGWYFVRNYRNFGQPLPPDQAGFAYAQDLGYAMPVHFVRFGQALVRPFYSGFAGVPDGLYSTCWGDGAWGGEALLEMRPPWNYELMAVTYLLALVPSLVIMVGFGSVLRQVLLGWRPEKLLLLGTAVASLCGIAYFYLQHPIYSAIKAHYALPGIASVCLFAAEGTVILAGQIVWREAVLAMALGTWALASLASFFVSPSSPQTAIRIARQHVLDGQTDRALQEIQNAVRIHPGDARLRLAEGRIWEWGRRYAEARTALAVAVQSNPTDADAQLRLAHALVALGQGDDSLSLLENVIRLAPDNPDAYRELALLSLRQNDAETSLRVARAGLRTAPTDPLLHYVLAEASMQLGETDEAIAHYQVAIAFGPEYTPALSVLAALYATHPQPGYRNGQLAVELAERASRLTEQTNPLIEDALAAAYAEVGNYDKAEATLHAAIERLAPDTSEALRQRIREHLEKAKAKQPWRDPALDHRGLGDGF